MGKPISDNPVWPGAVFEGASSYHQVWLQGEIWKVASITKVASYPVFTSGFTKFFNYFS
jgi:hypothetical protein